MSYLGLGERSCLTWFIRFCAEILSISEKTQISAIKKSFRDHAKWVNQWGLLLFSMEKAATPI